VGDAGTGKSTLVNGFAKRHGAVIDEVSYLMKGDSIGDMVEIVLEILLQH
jgi:hypothetical protein